MQHLPTFKCANIYLFAFLLGVNVPTFTVGTSSSSSVSSEWSEIVFGLILWVLLEAEDWALLCDLFLLMCE
jgi:hypothetical protein